MLLIIKHQRVALTFWWAQNDHCEGCNDWHSEMASINVSIITTSMKEAMQPDRG